MSKKIKEYKSSYLIKQLPSATAFFDKKLRLLHASDKWINNFEFELDKIFGKNINELFQKSEIEWQCNVQDCLAGKVNKSFVQQHTDAENNEKWIEWDMMPWYDEKEDIIGLIVKTTNVTQKIKKDQDLIRLQSLLKVKSEIAKIGSWSFNLLTNELIWCDMTKQLHELALDYKPDVETSIEFYKQGHSRNSISQAVDNAIQHGTEWNDKFQIITAKGKEKWVDVSGRPLYKDNRVVAVFGTFQDVNDQVLTNQKVRENERLLQTVMDNLPLNVFIKDLDSKKILVNKAECRYLGVENPDELLGKDDFELYPKKSAQISRKEDLEVMNSRIPIFGLETTSVKNDGSKTTFLTSKIPLLDNNDSVTGLVGISMDITELKQKEEELKKLIEVTTDQNKKLVNFAHIVSHNLRSHSANFSMLLDFLINESNGDERKNLMNMLVEASDNMLETLENLNEVVTINTNTNLVKKQLILRGVAKKVVLDLAAFLQNNNAKIVNRISEKITIPVVPSYLESILMNIITNSVKYKDPERNPVIELRAMKTKGFTVLSICDNGMGIDMEQYGDKLFGMYKTFHNNTDARGIGLYITKNQVEAMQGKITVSSEVGKGTTFNIYFNEKT